MDMQKLLLVNAQSMVNAANKEYNDALAMLAVVEKRCGITSNTNELMMMKRDAVEVRDNASIEHKIGTNHAPITDQGNQSKKLLSEGESNKRRKVSLTGTTAISAPTSSLGQSSTNSRGKDLSQMQKAISNRSSSSSIAAATTTTTAAAAANNVSTSTTSSTLPMNINQLLYGYGMPPYLMNNGMLPQSNNSTRNSTEMSSLDQLSRTGHGLNMMARPPPPHVVHTNTAGTTAHRISINDNNKNESVKQSWLGLQRKPRRRYIERPRRLETFRL